MYEIYRMSGLGYVRLRRLCFSIGFYGGFLGDTKCPALVKYCVRLDVWDLFFGVLHGYVLSWWLRYDIP